MKKLLSLFILTLLPLVASADYTDVRVIDGICYYLNVDKKVAGVNSKSGGYTGSVVIPPSVYAYFDVDGIQQKIQFSVTSIGDAFYGCSGLTSVTIPNSVTSIGEYAFCDCSGLTSVTIPKSVTSIDAAVFHDCGSLLSVTSLIREPFAINESVFHNYNYRYYFSEFTSAILYVPKGTKEKYESAEGWNRFRNIVEIEVSDQPQGDVNGDQTVDVADIASVIDCMAGSEAVDKAAADVNGDGTVDVADIATIISEMAAQARQQDIED